MHFVSFLNLEISILEVAWILIKGCGHFERDVYLYNSKILFFFLLFFILLVWIVILLHYVALITTTTTATTTTTTTVSSTVARTTTKTVPIRGLLHAISIHSNTTAALAGKYRHGMILQHMPAILSDSKRHQSFEYSALDEQGLLNKMLSKYQLYWLLHMCSFYLSIYSFYTHTCTYMHMYTYTQISVHKMSPLSQTPNVIILMLLSWKYLHLLKSLAPFSVLDLKKTDWKKLNHFILLPQILMKHIGSNYFPWLLLSKFS